MLYEDKLRDINSIAQELKLEKEELKITQNDAESFLYLCDNFGVPYPEFYSTTNCDGFQLEWEKDFFIQVYCLGRDTISVSIFSASNLVSGGCIDFLVDDVSSAFSIIKLFLEKVHDLF